MQIALQLAQAVDPVLAQKIAQDVIQMNGGTVPMGGGAPAQITQSDNIGGIPKEEHAIVRNARQQSNDAAQPHSDGVVNTKR